MEYRDGSRISLGDIVSVPIPHGTAKARVVMLGDTYEHINDIDEGFLKWVIAERKLDESGIVVEWVGENPFAHHNPEVAPVGNYMFSPVDEHVIKDG
jgi:hypothetical protein